MKGDYGSLRELERNYERRGELVRVKEIDKREGVQESKWALKGKKRGNGRFMKYRGMKEGTSKIWVLERRMVRKAYKK